MDAAEETLRNIAALWQRPVRLHTRLDNRALLMSCVDGEVGREYGELLGDGQAPLEEHLRIHSLLGRGAFGTVYKGAAAGCLARALTYPTTFSCGKLPFVDARAALICSCVWRSAKPHWRGTAA